VATYHWVCSEEESDGAGTSRQVGRSEMKRCPRCGKVKDTSEFYKNSNKKSGLSDYCKDCTREYRCELYNKSPKYRNTLRLKSCRYAYKKRRESGSIVYKPEHTIGVETVLSYQTCEIIKKHHEDLKDDPEHLSTEFIQNLVGRNCE